MNVIWVVMKDKSKEPKAYYIQLSILHLHILGYWYILCIPSLFIVLVTKQAFDNIFLVLFFMGIKKNSSQSEFFKSRYNSDLVQTFTVVTTFSRNLHLSTTIILHICKYNTISRTPILGFRRSSNFQYVMQRCGQATFLMTSLFKFFYIAGYNLINFLSSRLYGRPCLNIKYL